LNQDKRRRFDSYPGSQTRRSATWTVGSRLLVGPICQRVCQHQLVGVGRLVDHGGEDLGHLDRLVKVRYSGASLQDLEQCSETEDSAQMVEAHPSGSCRTQNDSTGTAGRR
jgi:hypothetical protein